MPKMQNPTPVSRRQGFNNVKGLAAPDVVINARNGTEVQAKSDPAPARGEGISTKRRGRA